MVRYPQTKRTTSCVPWNEDTPLPEGIVSDHIRCFLNHKQPLKNGGFLTGCHSNVEKPMAIQTKIASIAEETKARVNDAAQMNGPFDNILSKFLDPQFLFRVLQQYQGATGEAFKS